MTLHPGPLRMRGFTLIEAIMVIAITGIIGGMVAIFIKTSVDSYIASERRAELTDAADVTLRRLARDVRLALPNSLRVTDNLGSTGTCAPGATTCYIEFIPMRAGGAYRAAGDGSTKGNILDFTNASTTFDVVGPMPAASLLAKSDFIVVYNLGPDFPPADAYQRGLDVCDATPKANGCNIAAVSAVGASSITLDANPFAFETPPLPSPSNRFQVVPSTGPVSYSCYRSAKGNAMMRYTGYGFATAQPTAFAGAASSATAVANTTCDVDYAPNVLARTGILYVNITVTDTASGESVTAFREIHVDNSP